MLYKNYTKLEYNRRRQLFTNKSYKQYRKVKGRARTWLNIYIIIIHCMFTYAFQSYIWELEVHYIIVLLNHL